MNGGNAKTDSVDAPGRPHAPIVGRWQRLLGPLYFTGIVWYRLALLAARALPNAIMGPTVFVFSTGFFLALGSLRRALGRNLEPVLGPAGWFERNRRAHRTLYNFSFSLVERYEQFVPNRSFDCVFDGQELWEELMSSGRGFLAVTAHVGNWEVASTLPTRDYDCTVNLVREGELDPEAQEFVRNLVDGLGGTRYRTHFASDDFGLGVTLMRAIERGEIVALQGDRPRVGGRTVKAELFGREFEMPVGPAALARSANAPILPVFVERIGRRRYRIQFKPLIWVERSADRHADHEHAMRRFALEVEGAIRRTPYQWYCFKDLWPAPSYSE